MKILTVFTGGTIGSSVKNGIADVDSSTARILTDLYKNDSDIEFEFSAPFNILSENATTDTLSQICTFMLSVDFDRYDGVIVTHGSDTLAYTSAMLGLVLSWVRIPVVITASDYVLSLPYSNGTANFRSSVAFIQGFVNGEHKNTGVFTVWQNKHEPVKVYISTRLNEADGYSDNFSSWGNSPFGIIENGYFKRTENSINPLYTLPCEKMSFLKNNPLNLNNNILLLQSYVGLDFNSVNLGCGKSAVLLKLYHSATACTDGANTSFAEFAKKCFAKGIDVYIFSAKKSEYEYKSVQSIEKNSVTPLYNINTASAYAKLLLAYAVDEKYRDLIINTNLFYETIM